MIIRYLGETLLLLGFIMFMGGGVAWAYFSVAGRVKEKKLGKKVFLVSLVLLVIAIALLKFGVPNSFN